MERDIRNGNLYREAQALYQSLHQAGSGAISDASNISTDGVYAVFAGTVCESLTGVAPTRICMTHLRDGATRVCTFGPNVDRLPKFSPNGRHIAFLSDRHQEGDFNYILDPVSDVCRKAPSVEGWVEHLHWSPDCKRILLGGAGHGADLAGGAGAITSNRLTEAESSWLPDVVSVTGKHQWRHFWVYDIERDTVWQVKGGDNIWDAAWCGNDAAVAVTSPDSGEGLWYSACLQMIDVDSGASRELYFPRDQLGAPAASPSGQCVAIVEAFCSDRGFVAGELLIVDSRLREPRRVNTAFVEISHVEWRSDRLLLLGGLREGICVVGHYDVVADEFTVIWTSGELTTGAGYMAVAGFGESGDCAMIAEGFCVAPEIAVLEQGAYRRVKSLDSGCQKPAANVSMIDYIRWQAPDSLEIHGWLILPQGKAPFLLVMFIHGGPVWHWRPLWLGRRGLTILMLLERGYAVFLPHSP